MISSTNRTSMSLSFLFKRLINNNERSLIVNIFGQPFYTMGSFTPFTGQLIYQIRTPT